MKWELFKSNESKFCLFSALFISLIPLSVLSFMVFILWVFMSMNFAYFDASGFPQIDALKGAYYEFITQDVFATLPQLFIFMIILFFLGYYIGKLFIRPFEEIGQFAREASLDKEKEFRPKYLFGLEPLTTFSRIFFKYVFELRNKERVPPPPISQVFQNIKGPKFDSLFFTYCLIFVFIFSAVTSYFIFIIIEGIHENMITLAVNTLSSNKNSIMHFIAPQEDILLVSQLISFVSLFIIYSLFILSRFNKVNGPAFAFFKAMRNFSKGDVTPIFLRSYDPVHKEADSLNAFMKQVATENPPVKVDSDDLPPPFIPNIS